VRMGNIVVIIGSTPGAFKSDIAGSHTLG